MPSGKVGIRRQQQRKKAINDSLSTHLAEALHEFCADARRIEPDEAVRQQLVSASLASEPQIPQLLVSESPKDKIIRNLDNFLLRLKSRHSPLLLPLLKELTDELPDESVTSSLPAISASTAARARASRIHWSSVVKAPQRTITKGKFEMQRHVREFWLRHSVEATAGTHRSILWLHKSGVNRRIQTESFSTLFEAYRAECLKLGKTPCSETFFRTNRFVCARLPSIFLYFSAFFFLLFFFSFS
jgi:hypothetical protein